MPFAPENPPAGPDAAVVCSSLRKVYPGSRGGEPKEALKAIDLTIPRGSIFGLLGPNGAGKSTLINILAGLVNKTSGTALIWGADIDTAKRAARTAIGVVPQELVIDPFFTPRETLDIQAGLYGVPARERRTEEILDSVGLADKADAYARSLSGGMRRRLMIAKAMVHNPPVLVLDEPTAGVDVELRQQLWAHVRQMNEAGTTILLTTHYLEEAEQMCDRIAIINHGAVVACDRTATMISRLDQKTLVLILQEEIETLPPALAAFQAEVMPPRRIAVHYRPSEVPISRILAAVQSAGLNVADLTTEEPDLEDLFLSLTRRRAA
ncbi:MAG: multidrug ABC transporter ATP-binding protein [Rhodospirillaceae bacterium]|nr:multidrug ABC transporter ATP-binding protein [Rhodospirillaceae bacterium]